MYKIKNKKNGLLKHDEKELFMQSKILARQLEAL
jgi:hypothetical protein